MKIKVGSTSDTLEITDDDGKPLDIPVCALDVELRPGKRTVAIIETECAGILAMIDAASVEVDFQRVAAALRDLADKVAKASADDAFKLREVASMLTSKWTQG